MPTTIEMINANRNEKELLNWAMQTLTLSINVASFAHEGTPTEEGMKRQMSEALQKLHTFFGDSMEDSGGDIADRNTRFVKKVIDEAHRRLHGGAA